MQWRAGLLLCVATVSGLISALHMYLLSSHSPASISVALEIPVDQSQRSTSVELNIQSVNHPDKSREEGINRTVGDSRSMYSSVRATYYRQIKSREGSQVVSMDSHLLSPVEEELPSLGEDRDDYAVLLDTGDYELKEQDMDRPSDDRVPSHAHRQHERRQHIISPRQPFSTDTLSTEPSTEPLTVYQEISHEMEKSHIEQVASHSPSMEQVVKREDRPFVMTKEEYYARQATATPASPSTHLPPHKTHTSTTTHTSLHECTHPPCLQYLSAAEKYVFNKCQKRAVPQRSSGGFPKCQCRFRDGRGKKRVALVSLPGSGNTWVRGLLEKATGICTGSIYCDRTLREGGLCGEGLHGSSLVAVKTHDSSLQWSGGHRTDSSRPAFDKAIFLIRDPFRANIAEWNRQMSRKYVTNQTGSSHVKYVSSKAFFGTQPGWHSLVKYQTHKWRIMIGSNIRAVAAGRPVLIVFFEELKQNPASELTRMLEFLEVAWTPALINTTVTDGFTQYYRNHTDSFEHYTAEQKQFVNSIIMTTASAMQSHAQDIARHIRFYVQH